MKVRTLVAMTVVLAAIVAAPAWGQADGAAQTVRAPADEGGYLPDTGGESATVSVLDVLGKLLIAVAVAWGVIRAIRWWRERQFGSPEDGGRGGRRMWLEETLSLGSDGRLYLVEVEGRRVLLAAREGSVVEVADVTEESVRPSAYRSVRRRADGSTDELNVRQADLSTRAIRPDVVDDDSESWEQRRGRLLRELQEQG